MIYKHKGNGHLYKVLMAGQMKTPDGWQDCVIYMDLTGKIYVRERVNFYARFAYCSDTD